MCVCVRVCNPYDSVLAQIAEAMNNSLAEIQTGCGLTLCCRFSPKMGGWWFDYQLQWLEPCNLRSSVIHPCYACMLDWYSCSLAIITIQMKKKNLHMSVVVISLTAVSCLILLMASVISCKILRTKDIKNTEFK